MENKDFIKSSKDVAVIGGGNIIGTMITKKAENGFGSVIDMAGLGDLGEASQNFKQYIPRLLVAGAGAYGATTAKDRNMKNICLGIASAPIIDIIKEFVNKNNNNVLNKQNVRLQNMAGFNKINDYDDYDDEATLMLNESEMSGYNNNNDTEIIEHYDNNFEGVKDIEYEEIDFE